jgi:UPF0042 nucleotide-binding protein
VAIADARSVVVITGMSGAGRSTALHVLEDLGFYCIDNLPTPLLAQVVSLCAEHGGHARIGVGMDVRVRAFLGSADDEIDLLKSRGEPMTVIFLDADDAALVRRYSESRRPHPLSTEMPGADLLEMIRTERERLDDLRARADRVLDTSRLNAPEFRRLLLEVFSGSDATRMTTRVVSFGFKYGIPIESDLMFDVRFLPNPHFVPDLRPRSGKDPDVAAYVLDRPEGQDLLRELERLLAPLLPRYAREGKVVLTLAIGCTGGRHRSVAIAEALARRLIAGNAPGDVVVSHRDIDRGG